LALPLYSVRTSLHDLAMLKLAVRFFVIVALLVAAIPASAETLTGRASVIDGEGYQRAVCRR
jgi:hypothetical protein